MKYAFFSIIFALYSILSIAQATNAKQKSSIAIPISKTFIVSEATNRQLPAGLIFANNSFSAKKGYQIVADENGGAN